MVTRLTRTRQLQNAYYTHQRGSLSSLYSTFRSIVSSKLFVGGLSFNTQEDSLRQAFAPHGDVEDVKIITDRDTGRSRGFGFVTFGSEADAEAALSGMDGKVIDGRAIRVDYASSLGTSRAGGGFGRGGFSGSGSASFGGSTGSGGSINGGGGSMGGGGGDYEIGGRSFTNMGSDLDRNDGY